MLYASVGCGMLSYQSQNFFFPIMWDCLPVLGGLLARLFACEEKLWEKEQVVGRAKEAVR